MKKLFLFLFVFLFSNFLYSQNELALYGGVWEGEIFKKPSQELFCINNGNLVALDDEINVTGSSPINPPWINGAFLGRDSSIFISGVFPSDILFPTLQKYDKNWNLIEEIPVYDIGRMGGELSDGTILLADNIGMTALDVSGSVIWTAWAGGEISDFYVTEEDTIVSISTAGLYLFSDQGDLINEFSEYNFSHTVSLENGNWAGQKEILCFCSHLYLTNLQPSVFPI